MVHASTTGPPVSLSVAAGLPPAIHAALGLGSQEPGAAADVNNKEPPASASARSSSPSIIDLCGEDTETDMSSTGRSSSSRPSSRNSNIGAASVSSTSTGSRSSHKTELVRLKEQQARYETEGEEYGRGKRRVKPVAIRIGKDMVKIGNMYEVSQQSRFGGCRSTDQSIDSQSTGSDTPESRSKQVKGEQYIYDKIDVQASRPAPKPLSPKPKPKPKPQAKPKHTQLQAALKARNATVEAMKADARGRRAQFLRQHVEAIRPFVSPAVAARIESVPLAPAAAAAAARAGAVQQQPEVVTGGEMRDYQLLGLQFMLQRHEAGVPIILGDEMGLGALRASCRVDDRLYRLKDSQRQHPPPTYQQL